MSNLAVHLSSSPKETLGASRNISLDILKIIMAYMVIGLHADFLGDISSVGRALTVNGLFRIAVPVFFVINGFFFYSALQTNTAKWFKRAISLYVFWTLFYAYSWFKPVEFTFYASTKIIIKTFLLGHHHLWYLPAMIGAAVLLCLIRNFSSRILLVLALILFFVGVSIQYVGKYHLAQNITVDHLCNTLWIYRNFLFFAFPFFCIGYLLRRTDLYSKVQKIPLIFPALLGLVLLLIESYCYSKIAIKGFDIFASLIILCPLLFLLAISLNIQGESKSIALYSTAIYFIHPFFISIFNNFALGETALTIVVAVAATLAAPMIIKANSRIHFML